MISACDTYVNALFIFRVFIPSRLRKQGTAGTMRQLLNEVSNGHTDAE